MLAVSCLMPIASLPILLFLFVLLPRTQYPFWDYLNRSGAKSSGFSETVSPGGSASVSEVKSTVFRAICRRLPESNLYWRGIVLNGFKDNAWVRLPVPQEQMLRLGRGKPSSRRSIPSLPAPRTFWR